MMLIADTRSWVFITATDHAHDRRPTLSSLLLLNTVCRLFPLDLLRHFLDLLHGIANVDNLLMTEWEWQQHPRPSATPSCRPSTNHLPINGQRSHEIHVSPSSRRMSTRFTSFENRVLSLSKQNLYSAKYGISKSTSYELSVATVHDSVNGGMRRIGSHIHIDQGLFTTDRYDLFLTKERIDNGEVNIMLSSVHHIDVQLRLVTHGHFVVYAALLSHGNLPLSKET